MESQVPMSFFTEAEYNRFGVPISLEQAINEKYKEFEEAKQAHEEADAKREREKKSLEEEAKEKELQMAELKKKALDKLNKQTDKFCAKISSKSVEDNKSPPKEKYSPSLNIYAPWWHPKPMSAEPKRSNFSVKENMTYVKQHQHYSKHPLNNPSIKEIVNLNQFKNLQMRVAMEQREFQIYLERVAQQCSSDYQTIDEGGARYINEYLTARREKVADYPQYFIQHDSITFNVDKPCQHHELRHEQTLLRMGLIPKLILPNVNKHRKAKVPIEYGIVNRKHPINSSATLEYKNSSTDPNCERLANQYKCDLVISLDSIVCIMDNFAPYDRQWEMPFVVKEHTVTDDKGEEVVRKVVYVDNPLPPKILTIREKSSLLHTIATLGLLQHPYHLSTENLGGGSKSAAINDHDDSDTTSDNDDLFSGATMNSLETFGTADNNLDRDKSLSDDSIQESKNIFEGEGNEESKAEVPQVNSVNECDNNYGKDTEISMKDSPSSPDDPVNKGVFSEPLVYNSSQLADDLHLSSDPVCSSSDDEGKLNIDISQMDGQQDQKDEPPIAKSTLMTRRTRQTVLESLSESSGTDSPVKTTRGRTRASKQSLSDSSPKVSAEEPMVGRRLRSRSGMTLDEGAVKDDSKTDSSSHVSNNEDNDSLDEGDCKAAVDLSLSSLNSETDLPKRRVSARKKLKEEDKDSTGIGDKECSSSETQADNSINSSLEVDSDNLSEEKPAPTCQRVTRNRKRLTGGDAKGTPTKKLNLQDKPAVTKTPKKAIPKRSTLDDIMQDQEALFTEPGVTRRVSDESKPDILLEYMSKVNQSRDNQKEWKGLESFKDYEVPPPNCNISYDLWSWTNSDLRMMVTSKIDGLVKQYKKSKKCYTTILPKTEYQSHVGYEQVTPSESCYSWVHLALNHISKINRVRINAFNSVITKIEEVEMKDVLYKQNSFNHMHSCTILHEVLDQLRSLKVGTYLLGHTSGNSHIHIKRNVQTKKGVYNLHLAYLGFMGSEVETISDKVQWIPIDTNLFSPSHIKNELIPATFKPKDQHLYHNKKPKNRGLKRKGMRKT